MLGGLFRIIVTLDAATNKLMNEDFIKLIAGYLVDAALDLAKTIEVGFQSDKTRFFQYFIKPCIINFYQNDKVLCCTLEMLKYLAAGDVHWFSSISSLDYQRELSQRVCVVTTILVILFNDLRLHPNLSLSKTVIKGILHYIRHHLDSNMPARQPPLEAQAPHWAQNLMTWQCERGAHRGVESLDGSHWEVAPLLKLTLRDIQFRQTN